MAKQYPFELMYRITFPSDNRYVELLVKNMVKELNDVWEVGSKISQEFRTHKNGMMDFRKISLSLDEAIQNAVEHGNKFDTEKTVELCYKITHEGIEIQVEDEGPGFDPEDVPDPTALENLLNPRGRGILFMRGMMDEVFYKNGGTRVILKKHWTFTPEPTT